MLLTPHPFQRAGAWAAAGMAGKGHPAQLTPEDLDSVTATIVRDCLCAALAPKGAPGYAWWLVLQACYPNSPATHHARGGWGEDGIRQRLEALFAPDDDPAGPCDLCGHPAAQRWAKGLRPLAHSGRHVNSAPPGGRPLCRECRISMWALPYGSASNGSLVVTADCAERPPEQDIALRCAALNRDAIDSRLASWPEGNWYLDPAWEALREHPGQLALLRWRDGRRPWMEQWLISPARAAALEGAHPLAILAAQSDEVSPGLPLTRSEATRRLAQYRHRDDLVLAALDAGLTRAEIHAVSGLSRVTINKIIEGAGGETAVEELAT